jgi:hypothetical protein
MQEVKLASANVILQTQVETLQNQLSIAEKVNAELSAKLSEDQNVILSARVLQQRLKTLEKDFEILQASCDEKVEEMESEYNALREEVCLFYFRRSVSDIVIILDI